MKFNTLTNPSLTFSKIKIHTLKYFLVFLAGLLLPLGFSPFHLPGFTLLSLAFLYTAIEGNSRNQGLISGFVFGLGYFSFGVSWVIISIHDYGQLNYFLAGITTLIFITYLSLFPALACYVSRILANSTVAPFQPLVFSALWCFSELLRGQLFSGFPWLLVGTTLIDTPLRSLAPLIGQQGLTFVCVFLAALLSIAVRESTRKRYYYLFSFVLILLLPMLIPTIHWTQLDRKPISVGAVQANLSMRDKWDERLFWKLLNYYEFATKKLLGKDLIILPESAIPLPASYLQEYLDRLHYNALKAKSSLILGIIQAADGNETTYYNSLISLGEAKGEHVKEHLVPFGEYIPSPFVRINRWFQLPEPSLLPGNPKQALIQIAHHSIASLICYEIAYPKILRQQLPLAEWIVTISDNGWFGRSLASYQQLQMAQMLSLLTGRYQIVVNNDGLSSIINDSGEIVDSLPPFSSGILQSEVFPAQGITPWILWYEYPALLLSALVILFAIIARFYTPGNSKPNCLSNFL